MRWFLFLRCWRVQWSSTGGSMLAVYCTTLISSIPPSFLLFSLLSSSVSSALWAAADGVAYFTLRWTRTLDVQSSPVSFPAGSQDCCRRARNRQMEMSSLIIIGFQISRSNTRCFATQGGLGLARRWGGWMQLLGSCCCPSLLIQKSGTRVADRCGGHMWKGGSNTHEGEETDELWSGDWKSVKNQRS